MSVIHFTLMLQENEVNLKFAQNFQTTFLTPVKMCKSILDDNFFSFKVKENLSLLPFIVLCWLDPT